MQNNFLVTATQTLRKFIYRLIGKCSLLFLSGKTAILSYDGVRILTMQSVASGDRVQCSFLSDRSLSKHLQPEVNFTILSYM